MKRIERGSRACNPGLEAEIANVSMHCGATVQLLLNEHQQETSPTFLGLCRDVMTSMRSSIFSIVTAFVKGWCCFSVSPLVGMTKPSSALVGTRTARGIILTS